MSRRFAFVVAIAFSALVVTSGSSAAPSDLFFSEYIEGTSNNKALEIYNGTGAAIDLTAGAYVVQMYFNGSATAGLTITLAGTVAAGDVFVLAHASSNATILAQADLTNGAGWFNGDDAVVLRKGGAGGTILDVVGQVGVDPGTEWGSLLASTADNTLRRKAAVEAGDLDGSNAFDPSLEWDGLATDDAAGLGAHLTDIAPSVASTAPTAGGSTSPNGSVTVTFSEAVNVTGNWFTMSCTTSGAHTATVSGGPTTFTLDPDGDFVDGDSCTVTVDASLVSDQDAIDPPDTMAANTAFGFTVDDICADPITTIPSIQGTGLAAAITGTVTTKGVVVGDFEGSGGLQGFYLQDAAGDGDAATSDGIFVFTGAGADTVAAGDIVRVTGFARERFNQTTLNGANSNAAAVTAGSIVDCGTGTVASDGREHAVCHCRFAGALRGHARALPAVTRHLRVLRLRPVRRDRACVAAARREPSVHAVRRSTSPAPRLSPAPLRTAFAASLSTTRPARRTRSACAIPTAVRSRWPTASAAATRSQEHRRRARVRLQPVPDSADGAGDVHGGQPATRGPRSGGRHRPRRRDEHAELLPHARSADRQPARQHVRPGQRTSSAAAPTPTSRSSSRASATSCWRRWSGSTRTSSA